MKCPRFKWYKNYYCIMCQALSSKHFFIGFQFGRNENKIGKKSPVGIKALKEDISFFYLKVDYSARVRLQHCSPWNLVLPSPCIHSKMLNLNIDVIIIISQQANSCPLIVCHHISRSSLWNSYNFWTHFRTFFCIKNFWKKNQGFVPQVLKPV